MKVNAFISIINARTKNKKYSSEELMDLIKETIKPKSYISYDSKIELAMKVIDLSKNRVPIIPHRSRLFVISVIGVYTNLEVKESDFDVLSQNKLLEPILATFLDEYKICSSILTQCLESEVVYGNNRSIQSS